MGLVHKLGQGLKEGSSLEGQSGGERWPDERMNLK